MRIIATDIANLTDARYFAAWGAEGLAFNIDPSSVNSLTSDQLKEIVDWVEGPTTMVKIEGLEVPENLAEVRSKIDIKNIILGSFTEASELPEFEKVYRICSLEDAWQDYNQLVLLLPFDISKVSPEQREKVINMTSEREVFLDGNFKSSDLDLIKNLGFAGIILKGGAEEKVGFKSYDELDEILEAISDNF